MWWMWCQKDLFFTLSKLKNKYHTIFMDGLGVGIWNISTNEILFPDKPLFRFINLELDLLSEKNHCKWQKNLQSLEMSLILSRLFFPVKYAFQDYGKNSPVKGEEFFLPRCDFFQKIEFLGVKYQYEQSEQRKFMKSLFNL